MTDEAPLDVAALVRTIQEEAARRRAAGEYPPDVLARLDMPLSDETDDAPEALAVVESARPLRSTRRGGRAIVFGKRVARRLLAWYVAPIAADQTRFNLAVLRDLRALETRVARIATPFDGVHGGAVAEGARVDALSHALTPEHRRVIALGEPRITGALASEERAVDAPSSDPFDALDRAASARADAVVLAGVLPRLSARELMTIMPNVWRVLRPGGLVLADAPLAQAAEPGAVDPAYVRWVHSDVVRLLLDDAGFVDHRVGDVAGARIPWAVHIAARGAG